jgi:AraC-like DNA-binding protein
MGELLVRARADFRTRRRDEAVESVERLYGPHTLELKSRGALDMRLAGFDIGALNVSSIEYGCPAVAHTPLPAGHWVFSVAARGEILVHGRIARAGDAGVRTPQETDDVPMSGDLRLVNLKVPCAALDEAWRSMMGGLPDEPLRFLQLAPGGSGPALLLARLVQRLDDAPAYPAPYAAMIERRLQEATLLELLLAWPHSHSAWLERPMATRGSTERALAFIHAHADEVLTLAQIADAAGVGVRALVRGFERRIGLSPMRYLLRLRLDRVRADLLDAGPNASVTDIALRWGFGNLGDFAARYRERFGELPRESLRRGR